VSLRVRILLWILAVNVGVTALLVAYLLFDLNERDERSRTEARDRELVYTRKFEKIFDGVLTVDPTQEEVADAIRVLRGHALNELVKDGVILQIDVASQEQARSLDDRSVLPANAAYVNLKGAKHRAPSFDETHARDQIRAAVRQRHSQRDPQRRGWIAAPIRLTRLGARDVDAPIWGGGYFLLDLPEEPAESAPTFLPTTILLAMGAGTLTLLALTWLLLERSVLKPLEELAAGAQRVARREYQPPVPGAGSDEIGRVVASFNTMMADVGAAERVLTEKVEEATRRAEERGRGLVIAQRLAATGTLASGIAHEINNPLGGMLNVARRLKQEEEQQPETAGSPRRRYLQLLVDGLVRIEEIVRRVLQFTPRRVEPTVVPILELVRKAIAFADHRAKKSRVTLVVDGEDARVLAEAGEMQQVFLNLVLNACDALGEKGGQVRVHSHVEGGRVLLDVSDDGPGMSQEQQERCFDLFFTTKEPGKGTGLGLSVAHHIVEQHGGTLTVRSQAGVGTTFTVTLPVAATPR
jgi:signal transduction histidine kinase